MPALRTPRILLIDSYDSFTYNLAALCKSALPHSSIHIIKNDALTALSLLPLLGHFDAVVAGPGPGSPHIRQDIGVVREIWHAADEHILPVFGVCLGLQSLAVEYGAEIRRLDVVKHGQISEIHHLDTDIFAKLGHIQAVRYHSLHAHIDGRPDLIPLAWAEDGEENGRVLMALRHVTKPFWAVQYHPESVCTRPGGEGLIRNFWRLAAQWTQARGRHARPWTPDVELHVGPPWPGVSPSVGLVVERTSMFVSTRTVQILKAGIPRICEMLGVEDDSSDFVMLDSAAAPGRFSIIASLLPTSIRITYFAGGPSVQVQRGGDVVHEPLGSVDIWAWLSTFMQTRKAHGGSASIPFWGGLVGYLSYELGVQTLTPLPPRAAIRHPDANLVFVERSIVIDSHTGFAYIQSILPEDEDWLTTMVSRLEILEDPQRKCALESVSTPSTARKGHHDPAVMLPDRESYISKVVQAKEWLFSGDSYELCVTAPTRIVADRSPSAIAHGTSSSWDLYKILRSRNPAPHAAYIRLHPSTLVSSSPERFVSYSRPPDRVAQLRPIKGTVRKAPGITRAVAEEMLAGSKKEVAENLMIVDLIRHDLHGVVGEDVQVKQFCAVEEYETVWQLVSVIEGRPDPSVKEYGATDLGWEILRNSLPPGSMTGAPKKRSVEILRQIEGAERSIYSGVMGYADVGGGGDWSVIIRSCFKYDEHPTKPEAHQNGTQEPSSNADTHLSSSDPDGRLHILDGEASPRSNHNDALNGASRTHSPDADLTDEWTLGAGGAITALSDPVAEWEEMIAKVDSVLPAFSYLALS